MTRISVLIPTLNNVQYMDWCLKSLRTNTANSLQILVHGNCCENADLKKVCDKWSVDHYQSSVENLGIAVPTNQLAKCADGDIIMYSNDDIYHGINWDTPLLAAINPGIHYQYITPVMFERQYQNPSMNAPNDFGNTPENFREEEFNTTWKEKRRITKDIISCWGPPFMTRELWFEVGGFNELYYPGWGTDSDIVAEIYFRATRQNLPYEFRGVSDSPLYHIQSVGMSKLSAQQSAQYQATSASIFRRRWGVDIMTLYNGLIGTSKPLPAATETL